VPPTRREVIKTVVAVGAMPKAVGASRAGTTRPPPPPPMPATQLIVTPLAPLGPFVVGAPMSVTFTASPGVAPYVWSSTITPSWVTFTGSTSTATITGTVPSPANTFDSFVMAVNDHTTPTALTSPTGANFIITRTTNPQVFQPLRPILAANMQDTTYTTHLAVQGGTPPYTWTATGLPKGTTINQGPTGQSAPGVLSATWGSLGILPSNYPRTHRVTITVTDSSSTPSTSTQVLLLTTKSFGNDWTRITGVVLRPQIGATTSDPIYCAPLLAGGDLAPIAGMNHIPPYSGPYSNSPLTANCNTFNIGWSISWPFDYCRVFSSSDSRIHGAHQPTLSSSLQWQVGTTPGTYQLWLAAYSPNGGTITVSDANALLATIQVPATTGGNTPSQVVDATGHVDTVANWAAVQSTANGITGLWGGNPISIVTADNSNGNGGPMLRFAPTPGAKGVGLSYLAMQLVQPAGTLLDSLISPTTQDIVAWNPNWAYIPGLQVGSGIGVSPNGAIAYQSGNRVQAYYNAGTFPPDQWAEATVATLSGPTGGYGGPLVRGGPNNGGQCFYLAISTSGWWAVMYSLTGSDKEVYLPGDAAGSTMTPTLAVGDVCRISIKNWVVTATRNGIVMYQCNVPSAAGKYGSPRLITGGAPGFYAHGAAFGFKNLKWGPT